MTSSLLAVDTDSDAIEVGTLLAVSVGRPKDVSWQGRTVHTGVWKYPVPGPHTVRRLNIDGDGQGDLAGHGGPNRAVMVYQAESYTYWREQLGRDDLEFGNFGENFTVAGLPDCEVCVGDRYAIGSAAFEVSQPRVTCYRVGLRLNEPRLPSLLVAHGRPGFYLRVVREGVVQAGDVIRRVGSAEPRMTIAEVDALLYRPGHDRDEVARAASIGALSPGWRQSFESIMQAPVGTKGNAGLVAVESAAPAWPGFRALRVAGLTRETAAVLSVRLAATDGNALPVPLPGQFVALSLRPAGVDRAVVRNYSLSGDPSTGEYRVSVKLEPHGAASTFIHHDLAPGAIVSVAAPRGVFTLTDEPAPVVLVSAGIGVTPVLAMLYALADAGSSRVVWWLHGARNGAEHALATEAAEQLRRLPNAHVCIAYSSPLLSDEPGEGYTVAGRLNAELLASLHLPLDASAYVCGPAAFMADVARGLTELGLDAGRIHSETFGAGPSLTPGIGAAPARAPHVPDGAPGVGPQIAFSRSGVTAGWSDDRASLLEFAEACDVPVRWSCRSGVCHNCETALHSGSVAYEPEPIDPPAAGNVLLCCSRPNADLVLDL